MKIIRFERQGSIGHIVLANPPYNRLDLQFPRGSRNGNYTNGEWTREALEERRWVRDLVRSFGKLEAI